MNSKLEKIRVSNTKELQDLIDRFHNGPTFAMAFEFDTDELWEQFLNAVGLTIEKFNEKYYYFDDVKGIHISESENGYVWISTMGLIAKSRSTGNRYLNACSWQKIILIHLLDDAILLSENENTYDIDGYNYSMVEELTPALFHNTLFYFETLAKAYLSINEQVFPKKHKLSDLLELVKNTMFIKHHNNTLFHAHVIPVFEGVVNHISSIPGKFKEQYVKYDDNPQDLTVVEFSPKHLKEVRDLVEVSHDMVSEMYYGTESCLYLHKNLYQRLMDKCKSDDDRKRIETVYGFLLDQPQTV